MKTLLKVQSSLTGSNGESTKLADRFVRNWLARNPDGRVITRDLAAEPVPHLTAERFQAFTTPADQRSPEQQRIVAYSDALIAELQQSDVIVFAMPMYNFSVPSTVRAYFDHIARAGVTFRYTSRGSEGLINGKEVFVFITRGGVYEGPQDSQTAYLRQFLGFIGLTDVQFVYAQGLALGPDRRRASLAGANELIERIVPLAHAA